MSKRLIEHWLPIAEIGVESLRERTPMTPFPAPNRLHVWWARRPLVASRAAILASLLPADADQDKFMHALGIHGDPVAAKAAIAQAIKTGVRVVDPYGYPRAFAYVPDKNDREWLQYEIRRLGLADASVIDPTAGGGTIPFESARLGFQTFANDINPVAALIIKATVEWPLHLHKRVYDEFSRISVLWRERVEGLQSPFFPQDGAPDIIDSPCPPTGGWPRTARESVLIRKPRAARTRRAGSVRFRS